MKNDDGEEFRKANANATIFKVEAPVIKRTDFKVLNAGEFMEQEFESTEYIIDNLVGKGQIAVFGGDTGTGKTWVGLECAYSLSSGVPLFGYFNVKKTPALLIQFENENDDIRKRLELMKPYFVKKAGNSDFLKDFLVCPMDVNMEIFVDNWKRIEETLISTGYRDGVLIVDNMYTSTDKNIQDNNDLKELLKIIHRIRKKYNLTIILIAHSNKGVNEMKDLHYDQLQGGKVLASMVSNITQIHNSTASVDLRVMKITKAGRSGKNELHNIPFKLHWSDDDYVFTKGTIIPNIAVHFSNMNKRWEVELIKELADTYDFRASDYFDRDKFRKNLPEKYENMEERKIDRYLNKMQDWGLVEKFRRNDYMIKRKEIEDFDSK
jgi:KaiC/GvpD/RAD55 family RecA-like ATPase